MLENEILKEYETGNLKGIFITDTYAYLPLRITGSGKAERLDENQKARIVDRKLDLFSTDELMKDYARLPIVLEHPKNENGEFVKAGYENGVFVGNMLNAFIKGDEIWGIARLHNKELIEALAGDIELSTSPHFTTKEILGDDDIYLEIPLSVNSLAIVSAGFWDKKSKEPAIDTTQINLTEEVTMNKEIEKADSIIEAETTSEQIKEKADSSVEEVEKKEGEKLEEIAETISEISQEHKELNKEDSMPEIKEEIKGEEKIDSEIKEEVKEAVAETCDEVVGDEVTEEDKERDKLIEVIRETADSASGLNLSVPHIGAKRLKPAFVIKKFAQSNKGYVADNHRSMIEKIDSADLAFAKDVLSGMISNIKAKNAELEKEALKHSGLNHNGQRTMSIFNKF